jgi:hypothetical protein
MKIYPTIHFQVIKLRIEGESFFWDITPCSPVGVADHPGMDNRSTETAVLRRQSLPIIASLPIYPLE